MGSTNDGYNQVVIEAIDVTTTYYYLLSAMLLPDHKEVGKE